MATANDAALQPGAQFPTILGFADTPGLRTVALSVVAAFTLAVMVGIWMWSQQPDYRVLFSNFTDRDGGAIVASLQQMNVPYKYSEGGSAILVPSNQVHDARLKLASQGLPKGGNVGFELMENQKLGISQFLEQVNYQRALEGELARSIQAVSAVQTARVHLAIPKSNVFIREQQKPTASVLLNLYPGRTMDQQQVSAIVHLVASSVPELAAKNVTVVDQNGNLLSDTSKQSANNNLDPTQLKYVQDYQQNIVKRIESIISPIVGAQNVRAEATADIDFSRSEQAAETYRPNSPPESSTIRSQQSSESSNKGLNASGIPGALSNQPPVPATAPIVAPNGTTPSSAASSTAITEKNSTVNYEVDKTIKYTQLPMGGVKRLSVAIVINYKSETDKNGKVTSKALSETEKVQISDLAKEAMGFNKERGDTLNLVNSPFATPEKEAIVEVPIWKQADTIQTAKEIGRYIIAALVLAYLFFGFLKPTLKKITTRQLEKEKQEEKRHKRELEKEAEAEAEEDIVNLSQGAGKQMSGYEINMEMAKQLAASDPKIVANVIKTWVSNE
ncbi:MAG: flagellar basal-body MS-ring/collar protein FliF [Pseudomonadota bacterium]